MALFDLADLASDLQQDLDTSSATRARTRAENYLRLELGVEFTQAERVVTQRVNRRGTFLPLPGPLAATPAPVVKVNTVALVVVDDYEITNAGVYCPRGFGQDVTTASEWVTVEVTYTGGFTTIPAELVDWGIYLGSLAMRMGPMPATSQETVGGVFNTNEPTIVRGGGVMLPPQVLKALRAKFGSGRPMAGSASLR